MKTESDNGTFALIGRRLRRGTHRRSAEEIAEQVGRLGESLGTGSWHNFASCELDLISSSFDKGLDLLVEITLNSTFPEEGPEREKESLLAEIERRLDPREWIAMCEVNNLLFGAHPYSLDPGGSEQSVANPNRDYVYDLFRMDCTPEKIALAVSGDFDLVRAAKAISKAFNPFRRQGADLSAVLQWSGIRSDIDTIEYHDREQAIVGIGFPGPHVESDDRYEMDMLDAIISGAYRAGG